MHSASSLSGEGVDELGLGALRCGDMCIYELAYMMLCHIVSGPGLEKDRGYLHPNICSSCSKNVYS